MRIKTIMTVLGATAALAAAPAQALTNADIWPDLEYQHFVEVSFADPLTATFEITAVERFFFEYFDPASGRRVGGSNYYVDYGLSLVNGVIQEPGYGNLGGGRLRDGTFGFWVRHPDGSRRAGSQSCEGWNQVICVRGQYLTNPQQPINTGGQAVTIRISNVSLVPEPGVWAMLIGGFGLVGAALRRRRAVAA